MTFKDNFKNNISPEENAYWFIFKDENILTMSDGNATKPLLIKAGDISHLNITEALHVGELNQIDCYAVTDHSENGIQIPGTEWIPLRRSYRKFDIEMFRIYGRARHLLFWAENNRFCGRCGNPMELKSDERCFHCSSCGFTSYPKISPAVIVSIVKDGKLLLASGSRFPTELHSVLAGFVEPGESLEECIRREILEEVGIEIKNIKYFGSEPWPFPDSLMIGFTSEYAGGELIPDPDEITHAAWYGPDELPLIPGKLSISRALIDHFVENYKS